VAHEGVGGDPEREAVAVVLPAGVEHDALEAHVVGLGRRERREVVRAGEQRGARVQRVAVELVRPVQRAAVLERARRGPVEHAEAVGPAARVEAGVEAVGHRRRLVHGDVAAGQGVQAGQARQRTVVAGDLRPRVHAAIGAPRDRELHRVGQQDPERVLELVLHGPLALLARPAGEARAVVLDQQLRDHGGYRTRRLSAAPL
jgi:hypothetical protein